MLERPDVGLGPRLLAIEVAIRTLIEQASSTDPALRDRITAAAEAYLATIPPITELEREFINRTRGFTASIMRAPGA